MDAARINECPEREKYIVLLMDEMHIKEDVIYDKHSGNINSKTTIIHINVHYYR